MKRQMMAWMVLAAFCGLAQADPAMPDCGKGPQNRDFMEGRMPPPPPASMGNFIGKIAASDEFAKEIGLTPEQKTKLKSGLETITADNCKQEEQLLAAIKRQGKLMQAFLKDPNASQDEILKVVEEIGQCRTEQAKNSIKTILFLRATLDPAQNEKAHLYIRDAVKKRMTERKMQRSRFKDKEQHPLP